MAVSANLFSNAPDQAWSGNINWASDSIKLALLSAVPALTAVHWSDVSATEIAGTGYVAGGQALASKTHTVTAANSWATAWTGSAVHAYGDIVRPSAGNGFLYLCSTAGTSAAPGAEPTWPTVVGQVVTDNTAKWTCIGESITQWSSANVAWAGSTLSAVCAVLVDTQSGVAATMPLIALDNFGGTVSSTGAAFTVAAPALGWFWATPA